MPYTTTAQGHRVHYFDTKEAEPDRGNGKPPVVMIHGLGSSQNYYMPVIGELSDYRCVALDTYGAGRSKSNGESLSLEVLATDVAGLMDNLKIDKAVVAGHSMGGPMACLMADLFPDRIAGLVCIGPVDPKSVKPEMFTARIETVSKGGMEPLGNSIPTAATNKKSTALQKAMIRELIIGQDPASYASHCNVIVNMKDREPKWQAIKCPVLILAGEEDASAPLAGCEAIHKALGSEQKELKVMPNVGHWHCVEAGGQVAQEIDRFCSSHVKA